MRGKREGSYLDFRDGVPDQRDQRQRHRDRGRLFAGPSAGGPHGRAQLRVGSVQNIVHFKETGGEIKLTTATFWRPSGKNINKSASRSGAEDEEWGILPDQGYVLKLTPRERDDLQGRLAATEIIPRRDLPAEAQPEHPDKQLEMALKYLRE